MTLYTNVEYMQAANCRFCLHVGTIALVIGLKPNGYGRRLELFTPRHMFRYSSGG